MSASDTEIVTCLRKKPGKPIFASCGPVGYCSQPLWRSYPNGMHKLVYCHREEWGTRCISRKPGEPLRKNGKGYEPVSAKAHKANRVYSQWSFAELHTLISYKAALAGSLAVKVDANYTSQACPMCGHMSAKNRPQKGLLFVCQQCQYCLHADLVGARNITMRALLVRQDWARTGCLSSTPDASDREAKAARLQRYAELRWSPEVTKQLPV